MSTAVHRIRLIRESCGWERHRLKIKYPLTTTHKMIRNGFIGFSPFFMQDRTDQRVRRKKQIVDATRHQSISVDTSRLVSLGIDWYRSYNSSGRGHDRIEAFSSAVISGEELMAMSTIAWKTWLTVAIRIPQM